MFPSHGLNYLMARYCNFDADKRYQLADWRIRPLPKEMLYYARSDTHTLLYIYDNLRHELMESGGVDAIKEVFVRSKDVAMATYAKEEWDSEGETREGWRSVWRKWGGEAALGTEERRELSQMKREERLVRALHRWRDGVAREEDESPRYILGAQNLMMLASRAPTKAEGVLACIPPNAAQLKKRTKEIVKLIEEEVKEWEKDQEVKKQKLADGLLRKDADDGESEDVDMDIGEAVARPVDIKQEVARPTAAAAISAISNVAGKVPEVDTSIWAQASTATASTPVPAAAAPRTTIRGAVRSFASNLFGRSAATPASIVPSQQNNNSAKSLASTSSKLFGTSALTSRPSAADSKIDAVKAEFVGQVGGLLSSTLPSSTLFGNAAGEVSDHAAHQPETVAFVPQDQRATLPSTPSETQPNEQAAEEAEESASDKDDYIVISAAKRSKPSPTKKTSQNAEENVAEGPRRRNSRRSVKRNKHCLLTQMASLHPRKSEKKSLRANTILLPHPTPSSPPPIRRRRKVVQRVAKARAIKMKAKRRAQRRKEEERGRRGDLPTA